MDLYSGHINKLITELASLPGIGEKSAARLAFHLINMPKAKVERLAHTILEAKEHVQYCKECFTLTDQELKLGFSYSGHLFTQEFLQFGTIEIWGQINL